MCPRVLGWRLLFLAAVCVWTLGLSHTGDNQERPALTLSALVLGDLPASDKPIRVWLGITNSASTPKAICVRAVWYSMYVEDGVSSGGAAQPLLTHACSGDFGQHLLLPGGTHYVRGELRLESATRAIRMVRLHVDVAESDPYTGHVAAETSVTWNGTLAEASEAGKRLLRR